jgi:hypothetical protein
MEGGKTEKKENRKYNFEEKRREERKTTERQTKSEIVGKRGRKSRT